MLWLLILVFILCFLLYLLFLPIDIVINTVKKQYYVQLGFLARGFLQGDENYLIRLQLRTLLMRFNFYPLKYKRKKKKKEKIKPKKKSKRHFKWSYVKIATRLLSSFEVKQLNLDLDTGNCITNARFYPVFALMNYCGADVNVNFTGRNQLILHVQNRPIRIIKSFINPIKQYHGITL